MAMATRFLRKDHGDVIRRRMVEKKVTIINLADATDLSRQTIYDVIGGKAGDKAIYTVIDFLGIDIHDLLRKRETKRRIKDDPIRKSS